jgi:hypothetical protein
MRPSFQRAKVSTRRPTLLPVGCKLPVVGEHSRLAEGADENTDDRRPVIRGDLCHVFLDPEVGAPRQHGAEIVHVLNDAMHDIAIGHPHHNPRSASGLRQRNRSHRRLARYSRAR